VTESESNSLRRELEALAPVGEHPDADVLTAFAEGSLLERERQSLLGHLAGCAACREVLSLTAIEEHQPAREFELVAAAAAAPMAATPPKPKPATRAWLPWAAVAAGIIVVSGVALRYEENRLTQQRLTAQQEAKANAAPPLVQTPSAVQSLPAIQAPPPVNQPASAADSLKAAPRKTQEASALESVEVSPSNQGQPEVQMSASAGAIHEEKQATPPQLQLRASPVAGKSVYDQSAEINSAQTAELRSARQLSKTSAFSNKVTANALAAAPAAGLARPHWRINDQGQPERAFGEGSWQPVLPEEKSKMRVLSVASGEVWVGGENDRVYRSRDEGATWLPILLPAKSGSPHTIIHIRFEAKNTGTIEAADGTTWNSEDGGTTWH
jgi:hypothetical protein